MIRLRRFPAMLLCRQPALIVKCGMECVWLLGSQATKTKLRRSILIVILVTFLLWWLLWRGAGKEGQYTLWTNIPLPRHKQDTNVFVPARDVNLYIYSAIANFHLPVPGAINIIVTTMEKNRSPLQCCVLLDNKILFKTSAEEYFFYHFIDLAFVAKIVEIFHSDIYFAHQYSCTTPNIGQHAGHVTLTSSECSSDIRDYVSVSYPTQVPGGLAVCAKIAHSGGLDPERVIEWFELQRILGVDKVLLFDLGNPESLTRVLKYYQSIGFLDLQPYELPGEPANRTLREVAKRTNQFKNDESMAVLECRQRMAGYTFVMSHDMDEFIIPRRDITLKQFFQEKMMEYQDSAGFYFDTEFFIYNWGPSNPEEDMTITRYRKATKPHWECTKYVYLPFRTLSITTHSIYPFQPYTTYRIGADEAVIHHYRNCPDDVWPTCYPETILDHVMMRYHDLHERVLKVRNATNTKSNWNS